jgi:hypothetical protein
VRRLLFPLAVSSTILVAVACGSTNGDATVPDTLDASPLDAATNPQPFGDAAEDTGSSGGPKDSGKDVVTTDSPSDAPSDAPAEAGPSPDLVRINELYIAGISGNGDKDEYVELKGAPGTPLDELKLRLIKGDGTVTGEVDVAETAGDVIPATGLWVVGGSLVLTANRTPPLAVWGLAEDLGSVQLVRGTAKTVVDIVGYSTDPAGTKPALAASAPTATYETNPALQPPAGSVAFGRKAGAADTNDNGADFCKMGKSPGLPNAAVCAP